MHFYLFVLSGIFFILFSSFGANVLQKNTKERKSGQHLPDAHTTGQMKCEVRLVPSE